MKVTVFAHFRTFTHIHKLTILKKQPNFFHTSFFVHTIDVDSSSEHQIIMIVHRTKYTKRHNMQLHFFKRIQLNY